MDAGRVVEFMLLDRRFPRSIYYSLRLAEPQPRRADEAAIYRLGATAEGQRAARRARSELEFLRPGVLLESLEQRLAGLQKTCHDVGEALALQYFHSAPWVAWTMRAERLARHRGGEVLMWRLRVVHSTGLRL